MPTYRYAAIGANGETIRGVIEGSDRAAVNARLGQLGHHPFEIVEGSGGPVAVAASGKRARFADVTLFSRELAWLLRAGINLSAALEILSAEAATSRLTPVLVQARSGIRKGNSFGDALAQTGAFTDDYVSMIEIAEASGTLPQVLERLVEMREREEKIRRRVVSAMMYPSLLLVLGTAAVIFILIFVVPTLKEMIVSAGGPVPAPAQFVITASDWVIGNGTPVAVTIALALLAFMVLPVKKQAAALGVRIAQHLPLVGPIIATSAVVSFCRTLGTLLASGISLPQSLRLMRSASRNPEIEQVIDGMDVALRKGGDFLLPVANSAYFPALVSRMLRVGNETGNFTPSLLQATDMLQVKLEERIDRALTLLEPIIILALSSAVAFIIVSLMGAIISINDMVLLAMNTEDSIKTPSMEGRPQSQNSQAGFTLVELLVVMVILVLLASLIAPRVIGYLGSSRSKSASVQIQNLATSLELYYLDMGSYPQTSDGLEALVKRPSAGAGWNGPYLSKASVPLDPWGRPYRYAVPGKKGRFDLYTLGRDDKEGGTGEDADAWN